VAKVARRRQCVPSSMTGPVRGLNAVGDTRSRLAWLVIVVLSGCGPAAADTEPPLQPSQRSMLASDAAAPGPPTSDAGTG
jgi:hypothetical protein